MPSYLLCGILGPKLKLSTRSLEPKLYALNLETQPRSETQDIQEEARKFGLQPVTGPFLPGALGGLGCRGHGTGFGRQAMTEQNARLIS